MAIDSVWEFNNSHIYFYTPSDFAKAALYYPTVAGKYICDERYTVKRDSYDSILALFVLEGVMVLRQSGGEFKAREGELLLVDCYSPHEYFSSPCAKTVWVHFAGAGCRNWFAEVAKRDGQSIKGGTGCADIILSIISGIKNFEDELSLSSRVYALMCAISGTGACKSAESSAYVQRAKDFIRENLSSELTVESIAAFVHLSPSHFSKIFRDYTGFSPYAYLINQRIEAAKKLLVETELPISVIAYKVGFGSEANFIYCFGEKMGVSPLKFRNLRF